MFEQPNFNHISQHSRFSVFKLLSLCACVCLCAALHLCQEDTITQNAFQCQSGLHFMMTLSSKCYFSTITVWRLHCFSCILHTKWLWLDLYCVFFISLWFSCLTLWLCWLRVIKVRDMRAVIYFTPQIHQHSPRIRVFLHETFTGVLQRVGRDKHSRYMHTHEHGG